MEKRYPGFWGSFAPRAETAFTQTGLKNHIVFFFLNITVPLAAQWQLISHDTLGCPPFVNFGARLPGRREGGDLCLVVDVWLPVIGPCSRQHPNQIRRTCPRHSGGDVGLPVFFRRTEETGSSPMPHEVQLGGPRHGRPQRDSPHRPFELHRRSAPW